MEYFRNNLILKQIRIFHWSKNIILFIPAISSHQIFTDWVFFNSVVGFFSFSLLASCIYTFNDIIDQENDRSHPHKKFRPIASGELTIFNAIILCIICFITAFYIAVIIGTEFLLVLTIYAILNIIYSLILKKIVVLDIITLMGFYLFRLIAGHFHSEIPLSSWLLACAIFLFFSLGSLKRFVDLMINTKNKTYFSKVKTYNQNDSIVLMIIGIASGLISALILILYTNSTNVKVLYSSPNILIGLAPILLFWISRLWILAHRGDIKSDPIHYALKDKSTYVITSAGIICIYIAKYLTI